jgi:hypothetical protein
MGRQNRPIYAEVLIEECKEKRRTNRFAAFPSLGRFRHLCSGFNAGRKTLSEPSISCGG